MNKALSSMYILRPGGVGMIPHHSTSSQSQTPRSAARKKHCPSHLIWGSPGSSNQNPRPSTPTLNGTHPSRTASRLIRESETSKTKKTNQFLPFLGGTLTEQVSLLNPRSYQKEKNGNRTLQKCQANPSSCKGGPCPMPCHTFLSNTSP